MITIGRQVIFPGSSDGKEYACNAGDWRSIPGSGRSPREGNDTPLQYSCLGNPMDRGAWWAIVHGVTKSWTGPSDSTHMQYFTACVYYICLSIRLWMDTGCFHLLGILSNSSMDMLVQISVQGLFFSQ